MSREMNRDGVIATLNQILELELAGVVRYMHYSLMVFGHNRIPVVSWMRAQATESMEHAAEAGEYITQLDGHPSLRIGKLLETEKHQVNQILQEALEHEEMGVGMYRQLLEQVQNSDVGLEEYARRMITLEDKHIGEIRKMLRGPTD